MWNANEEKKKMLKVSKIRGEDEQIRRRCAFLCVVIKKLFFFCFALFSLHIHTHTYMHILIGRICVCGKLRGMTKRHLEFSTASFFFRRFIFQCECIEKN